MKNHKSESTLLYEAVRELRQGGGRVRVTMGDWQPDRHVFDLELPAAGDGAWEPLLWRTIRSVAYRRFLDQSLYVSSGQPRRVSICVEFTPTKRPVE